MISVALQLRTIMCAIVHYLSFHFYRRYMPFLAKPLPCLFILLIS